MVCVVGGAHTDCLLFWCLSESFEKKEKWGRLSLCLSLHGIMTLMIAHEGLDLLIARTLTLPGPHDTIGLRIIYTYITY